MLKKVPQATIAAVNGPAVGMGCDLALCCDFRIASEKASFAETYVRFGLIPSAGTYFLPRLVGLQKAFQMLMLGDSVNAEEALKTGLVYKVVPEEQLESATQELAQRLITSSSPASIASIKRAVWAGYELDFDRAMEFVTYARSVTDLSGDVEEGIKAFREKRAPAFTVKRKPEVRKKGA